MIIAEELVKNSLVKFSVANKRLSGESDELMPDSLKVKLGKYARSGRFQAFHIKRNQVRTTSVMFTWL